MICIEQDMKIVNQRSFSFSIRLQSFPLGIILFKILGGFIKLGVRKNNNRKRYFCGGSFLFYVLVFKFFCAVDALCVFS